MNKKKTDLRVRYQETDNMGVVYYANYFVWLEVARTEHLRSCGISYKELEDKGFYMMVASALCQYKYPARYDDLITIESWVSDMKNSSMTFSYRIFTEGKLAAICETVHVFTNKSAKPVRIPDEIRELFAKNVKS